MASNGHPRPPDCPPTPRPRCETSIAIAQISGGGVPSPFEPAKSEVSLLIVDYRHIVETPYMSSTDGFKPPTASKHDHGGMRYPEDFTTAHANVFVLGFEGVTDVNFGVGGGDKFPVDADANFLTQTHFKFTSQCK